MALSRILSSAGLALLGGHQAAALQSKTAAPPLDTNISSLSKNRACLPNGAYKQELENMMDLQYYGEMTLGGQKIRGIIDTGSFELVVFSKNCQTCGKAALFDEQASQTFKQGTHETTQSYGSGSCRSHDGWDSVELACFGDRSQSMWLAQQCQMPALLVANFNSIVGVGPPGQPEYMARSQLEQLDEIENKLKDEGKALPDELAEARTKVKSSLEDALSKPAMLENFGIKTFSQCLSRRKGAPGYMVWNDETREGRPETKKIQVAGNITWGIKIDELSLAMPDGRSLPFGCEGGCGGVVDTGTSLVAAPTSAFKKVIQLMQENYGRADCSDLRQFPDLVVKTSGHSLRLPPSSFLGTMVGEMASMTSKFMHRGSLAQPIGNATAEATPLAGKKQASEEVRAVVGAAKAAAEAAAAAAQAAKDATGAAASAADAAKAAAEAAAAAAKAAAAVAAVVSGGPLPEDDGPLGQPASEPQAECELLMMDIGEQMTSLGPLLILGMPWFRQFYTTFDLGAGRGDRSIFVTPAGDNCDPDEARTGAVATLRNTEAFTPRQLDASKIRAPQWLDKLPEGQF